MSIHRKCIIADLLFAALKKCDFRLRPNSPMFKVSFQPILGSTSVCKIFGMVQTQPFKGSEETTE